MPEFCDMSRGKMCYIVLIMSIVFFLSSVCTYAVLAVTKENNMVSNTVLKSGNHRPQVEQRKIIKKGRRVAEENNLSISALREYILLVVAIVTAIAGIIFWVQNVDDDKIERLERDIEMIQVDINKIKENNTEILRVIGRLEGKMDNLK